MTRPMEKTTNIATYISAVGTALGGLLTLPNIALLLGVVVTIALGLIQWQVWYSRKRHEAELHAWAKVQHDLRVRQMEAALLLGQNFDAPPRLVNQLGAGDPADPT
ncbi:MAG: hypothetical protein CVV11_19885 [Gammaproteobacteria bacterium HGW-Gammaproteobacteria-15]|nr:MAG: hypothetical protein CVV11_19885 [Gammaproteobacteria bacterium HGW-Gammaproteobacteria-15]